VRLVVLGLGFKGDIVTVSKRLARNHMFPASVAEYVNKENLKKYEHIQKVFFDCDLCRKIITNFDFAYNLASYNEF